jgi:DNA polymerase (family 10)
MAAAAQARGDEYIALTDRGRHVAMTHGLDPARLARQIHETDRLDDRLKNFTILRGIEVDILKDGSLDLPDSSLEKLDIVVAAVHSNFDLLRQAQTDRVVRALENRHVSVLAHPIGRLIGEREPYAIDMDAVIVAARKVGCSLEINAEPDRLDLSDLHAHAAKLAGVKLAVSTDAHSIDAFQCMRFGIDQSRRAWLTTSDVLNSRALAELRKLLKRWTRSGVDVLKAGCARSKTRSIPWF